MTLTNTRSSVKVGNYLSETFDTQRGLRQGDSLSSLLFNIGMEYIIKKAEVHRSGCILTNRSRTKRDVTRDFGAIEKESARMGLSVNESKTKFMICSSRETRRSDAQLTAGNYNFDTVNEFVYLGSTVTDGNNISLEIKQRC